MTASAAAVSRDPPLGLIVLNLGGPSSLDDVEPFLRRLFGDPDVIQLGWARPAAAAAGAHRRPAARADVARRVRPDRRPLADPRGDVGAGGGGRGGAGRAAGFAVEPAVAMAAWQPTADEALANLAAAACATPSPCPSTRTSRAPPPDRRSISWSGRERRQDGFEIAAIKRYPDVDGYVRAVIDRIEEATATLPPRAPDDRARAVLGARAARGVHPPRRSVPRRRADHHRTRSRRELGIEARARLCFQSRVGPQKLARPLDRGGARRAGRRRHAGGDRRPDRVHGRAHRDAAGDRHRLQAARREGRASSTSPARARWAATRRSSVRWPISSRPPRASAAGSRRARTCGRMRVAVGRWRHLRPDGRPPRCRARTRRRALDEAPAAGRPDRHRARDGFLCERGPQAVLDGPERPAR